MCNDNPISYWAKHTLGRFSKCTGAVGLLSLRSLQDFDSLHVKLEQDSEFFIPSSGSLSNSCLKRSQFSCFPHIPKFGKRRVYILLLHPTSPPPPPPPPPLLSLHLLLHTSFCTWLFGAARLLAIYLQASSAPRWPNPNITSSFTQWIEILGSLSTRLKFVFNLFSSVFHCQEEKTYVQPRQCEV